jgi:hypothetical protein
MCLQLRVLRWTIIVTVSPVVAAQVSVIGESAS